MDIFQFQKFPKCMNSTLVNRPFTICHMKLQINILQISSLGNLYLHFCKFVMAFEYSLSVHEQGGEETRAATLRSERRLSTTLLSIGIVLATPSAICHAASENPINKILVND